MKKLGKDARELTFRKESPKLRRGQENDSEELESESSFVASLETNAVRRKVHSRTVHSPYPQPSASPQYAGVSPALPPNGSRPKPNKSTAAPQPTRPSPGRHENDRDSKRLVGTRKALERGALARHERTLDTGDAVQQLIAVPGRRRPGDQLKSASASGAIEMQSRIKRVFLSALHRKIFGTKKKIDALLDQTKGLEASDLPARWMDDVDRIDPGLGLIFVVKDRGGNGHGNGPSVALPILRRVTVTVRAVASKKS
ncbi:hypothetical protein B0H16DRAFT_1468992 [Mycena metata]|uniref:Uncharacterized protein n=1 Tax=Mycena metata TaxID=1033252 RepID=A0AAD7MTR5_9AGAR|nr:hypothetical protein B0H16DRAFT_1468992 [Mycena metata]